MKSTKSNHETVPNQIIIYIGIDVHKKRWVVTTRALKMELKTFSMNPSPKELLNYLKRHHPDALYVSCYEAGFCGFWIHKKLISLGIDNRVIHAADVPTMHKEKVTKRDKVDSRKLARELENGTLKALYVPSIEHQQLRSLSRLRAACQQQIGRTKNRIKGYLHYYGVTVSDEQVARYWSCAFINELEKYANDQTPGATCLGLLLEELKEHRIRLNKTLRELRIFCRAGGFAQTLSYLCSIPGIGFVSAATLVTEIIDINRFKRLDQLCSLCGLVPCTNSSADKEKIQGLTPRRNKVLKYILIEAAWIAIRKDPQLLQDFARLTTRMSKNDAIIRIARKLANRIRFVWKNQTPYKHVMPASATI